MTDERKLPMSGTPAEKPAITLMSPLKTSLGDNVLYDAKRITVDTFTFRVNSSDPDLRNCGIPRYAPWDVNIVFTNSKFERVELRALELDYSNRSHWWISGAIAAKIRELEGQFKNGKG